MFLSRIIAVAGVALVWLPILATLAITLAGSIRARTLHFDYLMPAELFPAALVGGGLLLWAALRARLHRHLIAGGVAVMVGLLLIGQLIASATGLASGAREPAGWPWLLVLASIAGYTLAVIALGVAGLLLLADLVRRRAQSG